MCVEALDVWYGNGSRQHDLAQAEGEVINEIVSLQMQAGLYLRALNMLGRLQQHNEQTLEVYRTCIAKLAENGDAVEKEIAGTKAYLLKTEVPNAAGAA